MVNISLIESVKAQNEKAFQKMYENCIRYVYSIVRRYVVNESDHQDVIQEIFARVFISIDSFDEKKGDFKFWLRRITINLCIQHYKKSAAALDTVSIQNASNVSTDYENRQFAISKKEISNFLHKMPDGYKQVFMLVVIDDFSHNEVSELLGMSPETSRSQLHRAKKWLKENLSRNNLKLLVGEV